MNKAQISEIFFSLQGEGPYIGIPQIFIRFWGCNLQCRFCDTTDLKPREYDILSLEKEINVLLKKYGANYISLTGGEPLLQAGFIQDFFKKVKIKNYFFYLETNGILYKEFRKIKEYIDIVAMDIKLDSATQAGDFWDEHENFLKLCCRKNFFVKTVIALATPMSELEKAVSLIKNAGKNITLVLQPNHMQLGAQLINKCIKFQSFARRYLPDVRVIAQVHKLMGVR